MIINGFHVQVYLVGECATMLPQMLAFTGAPLGTRLRLCTGMPRPSSALQALKA